MVTFGQLKTDTRERIFPTGEAPNLAKAHDKMFVDALIDLQTFVECLQQDNTDLYPQCATFYKCGLTIVQGPRGIIRKVEVIDKSNTVASGKITATKTDNEVEASAPIFDPSMVGSTIQFAGGLSFLIVNFVDSTHVLVADTTAAPSGEEQVIIDGGTPSSP